MKKIALIGSTGSIGRQVCSVVRRHKDKFKIESLVANSSAEAFLKQAEEFRPSYAVLADERAAAEIKDKIPEGVRFAWGEGAAAEAVSYGDTAFVAATGFAGLKYTLKAIELKKDIALANKETLVCAGELVMDAAEKYGAEIVPVDSEHSAVFQCLQGCRDRGEVRRILLTCSGGPFYGRTFDELEHMTAADALRHPNWHMGPKITVDSATLMNKGLEIIEAMRLYRLPVEQVQAVIHRQSIVHSLVEFRDGALLAQLGTPDMKLPIRYAMTYPHRAESPDKPLDLLTCGALTFAEPDERAFPCLRLARYAAAVGGTACAILNGANEAAVGMFLRGEIGFNDISRRVERALERVPVQYQPSLADILEADKAARRAAL